MSTQHVVAKTGIQLLLDVPANLQSNVLYRVVNDAMRHEDANWTESWEEGWEEFAM